MSELELIRKSLERLEAWTAKTDERFDRLEAWAARTDERLYRLEAWTAAADERFERLEAWTVAADERFGRLESWTAAADERFTGLEGRTARVEERLEHIEANMATRTDLARTRASLEEGQNLILRVVRGHSDQLDAIPPALSALDRRVGGLERAIAEHP